MPLDVATSWTLRAQGTLPPEPVSMVPAAANDNVAVEVAVWRMGSPLLLQPGPLNVYVRASLVAGNVQLPEQSTIP